MFNKEKVHLGMAPIGWCNDDMPELGAKNTFRQTVSEMALAGFAPALKSATSTPPTPRS